jgi:hypothetical protein
MFGGGPLVQAVRPEADFAELRRPPSGQAGAFTHFCDAHERVVHATANLPLRAFAGCHTSDAVSPIAGRKGAASTTPTITAGLVVVRELRAKHGDLTGIETGPGRMTLESRPAVEEARSAG